MTFPADIEVRAARLRLSAIQLRSDIQDAIIAGTLPLTMVPYLNTSFVDAGNACLTASATLADFVSRTLAANPVIPRANVVSLAAARARR